MGNKKRKKEPPKPDPRQRIGDYRIFVGAFPTGELAEQIQAVRQAYDPQTAVITAPHVTLAGTYWRVGKPIATNERPFIEQLTQLQPGLSPFTLELGGIYTFGNRVIYLGVKPTNELLHIRQALLAVMGRDKHRHFRPHLTLAIRLPETAVPDTLAELQQTHWQDGRYTATINQLQLMQRGPDDPAWRTIHTINLQAPPPPSSETE